MQNNYYQNNYYKYGHQNNNFNTTMSQTTLKDFEIISKLGEGSFSQVFQVRRKSDGLIYAMKKVKMNLLKEKEKENALNEVRILASLNDEYIVHYKEAFIDEQSQILCVVMEFAAAGDLQGKINSHMKNKTMFPESEVWKALYQMSQGLQTLHDMQILHRDLKCANVFLSQDGVYKLGDLNVSKVAKKGLVYTQTGTPYYASPEVWRDQPYDIKSDIWSLGCVLYEMCALKPPFRANDMEGLYKKVQKGEFERIPRRYSDDLQRMLSHLLKVNPSLRPSCEQIINNPTVQRSAGENVSQYIEHSDKKLSKKASKAELLQTIKLPKNLGLLKGKLPKANYKTAESIDDINHYYEKIEEKLQIPHQSNKKNRVVSAGTRRTENYVNNLGMRPVLAPIQRSPNTNNENKQSLINNDSPSLQQKQENPSQYNSPSVPNMNNQIKPRALGRPISGAIKQNGNGIPTLSPIQGLAKVQPHKNRPISGISNIAGSQNNDNNQDINNNKLNNPINEPIMKANENNNQNSKLQLDKPNQDILSNINPYRKIVDRNEIPQSNQDRYGARNVVSSKNLTPQQYLMNQQYLSNNLYSKYQNVNASSNENLSSKLSIREKALIGGIRQSQNENPQNIADKYIKNSNQNISRNYSEQNVLNQNKPARIQSSKPYYGGNDYNYDIYQKDNQQSYKSPQYGQADNNNYGENIDTSNNAQNNQIKQYNPHNYMYSKRQQSANILGSKNHQYNKQSENGNQIVYGKQAGYYQNQIPTQQSNQTNDSNRGSISSRPIWWG